MEKETYKVNVYCRNCGWEGTQDIPKGSHVETLSLSECPICGCRELKSKGISKRAPITNNDWSTN